MAKIAFSIIMLIHGLIHLMGFLKAFKLGIVEQLTQDLSKPVGLIWGAAALLFVISVIIFSLNKDWWWIPAASAVIISQVLIFLAWHDAKFGTIANIIILIPVVAAYGIWGFNKMVSDESIQFTRLEKGEGKIITREMIDPLPQPVKKWMTAANILGKEFIRTVHLKQAGEMKTKPDGNWLPFKAEQYFKTELPGFYWIADVKIAPMIHIAGRDMYNNGNGHMLIKLLFLIPVVDAKGKTIDQGTMLRYIAEMIWFPTAALSEYISWEEIDSLSAKATMSYGDVTASGIFRFNTKGDCVQFEAKRYYDRKEGATLEDWLINVDDNSFEEFQGIRIPVKSSVTWKLETGDFNWLRLEIFDVVYNAE